MAGFGRLVDGGDLGDSYNYSPPANDSIVDVPESVSVEITEHGPVRATAVMTSIYRIANHVDGGSQRRIGEHLMEVVTTISVCADSPLVSVESTFVNPGRDHRLRVHLPLPTPASISRAECAFAVVERGTEAEGRADEFGLPTFPSRRFVQSGGLTVIHEGINEYELVDIQDGAASTLALTLLRSTGMLSRLGMAYRPFPAGPLTPVEGLQLLGRRITSRYAIVLGEVDPYEVADEFLLPLETAASLGGGTRPLAGTSLEIRGAEVSSVRRRDGHLEVRLFNPLDGPTMVEIPGRSGWRLDLRGRMLGDFDNTTMLEAYEIATLQIDDAPR